VPVHNSEIAAIFDELANLLDIQEANPFRIRAYRNAAVMISNLPDSLSTMVSKGDNLTELPTIGKELVEKITEIVNSGHLGMLDQLHQSLSGDMARMTKIPGLGPKRVMR